MATNILIVEDNFIAADELKDRLKNLGYSDLENAFTGEEAIEKALRWGPDLILMDINLGDGIDGIEAATRIREQRNVPVIYLTAYDDDATLKRSQVAEPYAYILKPFEERELQIAIEIALYKHAAEYALQQAKDTAVAARKSAEIARQEAEEANRAKSRFLANMSHELRTPLNAISGYAQLFMNDETLTEKQRSDAGIMYRSGEHLLEMINDILDLSKIEARRVELLPEVFHLPEFLNELIDMIRVRAYRKGLTLTTDIAENLPDMVWADDKRLRQILLNLLSNAVKFTEKGEVTLKVTATGRADDLRDLLFEIADTGPGIPPERLDEIFEPFQRVEERQTNAEGTGLGLAISRELAQLMGGVLTVASTPGVGSRFQFTLTVKEMPPDAAPASARTLQTITGFFGPRRTVLVVDDVEANRDVLRTMLTRIGFEVMEASNGYEAVEKAHAGRPDVIVMDLVMPGLDGLAAIHRIRKAEADSGQPGNGRAVILGVSASAPDEAEQHSFQSGCDSFLLKPLRLQEVLRTIGEHLPMEWEYASPVLPAREAAPHAPALPPEADLRELYDAADIGDIEGVTQWLTRIEAMPLDYQAVVGHVRELAASFRLGAIRTYLTETLGYAPAEAEG